MRRAVGAALAVVALAGAAWLLRPGEPEPAGGALRVLRGGAEVEVSGPLSLAMADALRAMPTVRVVQLDSLGGSPAAALAMADAIRAGKRETAVTDRCVSMCVAAFMAGARRWIGPFATIGLTADAAAAYRTAGLTPSFVAEAVATPPGQAWSPTRDEMMRAGLATDRAAPDQFALAGFGPAPTAASIRGRLLGVPLYRAVSIADPRGFDDNLALWVQAVLHGDAGTAAFDGMQALLSRSFQAALPHASDDLLVAHAALFAEEIAWMQRNAPALCARWADAQGGMPGPTDDDLVLRRHELMVRVIGASTGSTLQAADAGVSRPECDDLRRLWTGPMVSAETIRSLLR